MSKNVFADVVSKEQVAALLKQARGDQVNNKQARENEVFPELSEYVRYDKDTGKLYWKERPLSHFISSQACKIWNTKHAGTECGTTCNGYRQLRYNSEAFKVHRIILYMLTGELGISTDHIDGNTLNNRPDNLRWVNHATNMKNKKLYSNNTTGKSGVFYDAAKNKFKAQTGSGSNRVHLGTFNTKQEAIDARQSAESEYHTNHGR